jgi:hypothetical protein
MDSARAWSAGAPPRVKPATRFKIFRLRFDVQPGLAGKRRLPRVERKELLDASGTRGRDVQRVGRSRAQRGRVGRTEGFRMSHAVVPVNPGAPQGERI